MPMCPFAMVDYKMGEMYSLNGIKTGYLVQDYYLDLEADGSEEDFDQMLSEAITLGVLYLSIL